MVVYRRVPKQASELAVELVVFCFLVDFSFSFSAVTENTQAKQQHLVDKII